MLLQPVINEAAQAVGQVLFQRIIDALNTAVRSNKLAMLQLIEFRVPVGEEMEKDPNMVPYDSGNGLQLGMLGVINGLLGAIGLPHVQAVWANDAYLDSLVGFTPARPRHTDVNKLLGVPDENAT